jgi:hypothetical protein
VVDGATALASAPITENRRRHKQNPSSAKEIGGFATDDRANGRSQQNATDNDFLGFSR